MHVRGTAAAKAFVEALAADLAAQQPGGNTTAATAAVAAAVQVVQVAAAVQVLCSRQEPYLHLQLGPPHCLSEADVLGSIGVAAAGVSKPHPDGSLSSEAGMKLATGMSAEVAAEETAEVESAEAGGCRRTRRKQERRKAKRRAAAGGTIGPPSAGSGAMVSAEQQACPHRRRTDDIEPVPDVPGSSGRGNGGGPEALGPAVPHKLRAPCDREKAGAGALVRDVGGAGDDDDAIWAVDCVPAAARPARAVGFAVEYLLGVPPGRAVVVAGSGCGGVLG